MARPSRLTPKLRERIVHELADGVPVTVTAQRVGVPVRTLHSWLAAGKVERREQPEPATAVRPTTRGSLPTSSL